MNTTRALTLFLALALLALVFLALSTPTARANPGIVRVTVTGTTAWPCGDQSNWSNPCALQTALTRSVSGSELWVAAGTYTPTVGVTRTVTFQLQDGIALYGGFAMTETLRSQRNFTTNVTILSGDIGVPGDSSDNAYHVVTGSGTNSSAILDGFTVTGGKADGPYPQGPGGGMYNYQGSPTVTNVTFVSNAATNHGGGMYNEYDSAPTLTNVTFSGNSAGWGGGMVNISSNPTLTSVTFASNTATNHGGGMANSYSNPTLTNVTFVSNTADWDGGGMYNYHSSPMVTNVTFSGNSAPVGGGMNGEFTSSPTLNNVTFSSNTAAQYGGGIANWYDSSPTLRNTIFWGNTAPNVSQIYGFLSTPSLSDSVVQGGYAGGTHIITADPRLGALGNWGGSTPTIPLLDGSSAIDAGNDATCAATDQRGILRPQGAHCDIGAYESQGFTLINLPLLRK